MKQNLAVFLFSAMMLFSRTLVAAPPIMDQYASAPFWLEGQTIPHVLLVLERDWKMFYPAYNNLSDLDDDGVIDIGFNPAVTYVGYFDSDSCYNYDVSKGYFVRLGPTTPQTKAELENLIPEIIKNQSRDNDHDGLRDMGVRTPLSKHGVCRAAAANQYGQGEWHGNWLNFAMTSRMDAIRKVLYGGKRYVDTTTQTILELTSYLPPTAHTWGGELLADDLWGKYAKTSPWYYIPNFTGYSAPDAGKMHFWARTSYYDAEGVTTDYANSSGAISSSYMSNQNPAGGRRSSPAPLFRVAAHIPSSNWHPRYITPLRIWDWVGDHALGALPNDWTLVAGPDSSSKAFIAAYPGSLKPANQVARNFNARVEVCNKDNLGPQENCRLYGENYKPFGLLQEYGETDGMYFGLLTGTINATTRWQGGVVRHHIQRFGNYVDVSTGIVTRPGLIDTIDRFQVTGVNSQTSQTSSSGYANGTQAGNPLGEMVYEGVRYLSRMYSNASGHPKKRKPLTPTSTFMPSSETTVPLYNQPQWGTSGALPMLKATDWASLETTYLGDAAEDCPKPIILVLSEVFPDHDNGTTFASNQNDFRNTPRLADLTGASLPGDGVGIDIKAYLDLITNQEQLKSTGNELFFYPQMDPVLPGSTTRGRGVCIAHRLPGGLASITGHCPSEPSLEGSYNLAAIAYYAHTHNMYDVSGKGYPGMEERFIDFYGVGIPGNFPDISFTVDDERSLTIMPITVSSDGGESVRLRTLINFFVDSWEVDVNNRPYRVKFATNFEYTTTPAYQDGSGSNNLERDIFNRFEITLLTTSDTDQAYREAKPIFINSGPFRTRNLVQWERDKRSYEECLRNNGNNQNACYGYFDDDPAAPLSTARRDEDATNRYYYAFRNPVFDPEHTDKAPLDISAIPKEDIAGIAIYNNSHGSYINIKGLAGYTISGVEHPGPYIEVGYTGSGGGSGCADASYYSDTDCFSRKPIVMEGDYDFCKANPGACTGSPPKSTCNAAAATVYEDRRGLPLGYCNPGHQDEMMTPWECPFSGYSTADRSDLEVLAAYGSPDGGVLGPDPSKVCGAVVGSNATARYTGANRRQRGYLRYVQVRSFKFDTEAPEVTRLPNPMKVAAKYGGFRDSNNSGLPDTDSEWKRPGSGSASDDPYNYFEVANITDLPNQLGQAFETIADSVSTGTANAASINTVLGGGVSLQSQYRTEYRHPDDNNNVLKWTGTVFAFFTDRWGNMRADTDGDQKLSLVTSPPNIDLPDDDIGNLWDEMYPGKGPYAEIGDKIVHVVSNPSGKGQPFVYLCRDINGNNNGGHKLPTDIPFEDNPNAYPPYAFCERVASFEAAQPLWNAAERLAKVSPAERTLYTNFGAVDSSGTPDLTLADFAVSNLTQLHKLMGQSSTEDTRDLIEYTRGVDDFPLRAEPFRNRTGFMPWYDSTGKPIPLPAADKEVWRMGDIINSKPVIVGEAKAGYQFDFGSRSYAEFVAKMAAKRRNVAYFGSNDGILHAVNLGFFGSLADGRAGYMATKPTGVFGPYPNNFPLGNELWGYVPTAVLPHLQWLADPDYPHSYYVDMEPYITDITDASGKWRTVMIVGLRLGGRSIEQVNADSPPKYSYSEFIALDVTDPDSGPPKILWRFSDPSLGLSSTMPSIVRSNGKWYAVLASGPTSDVENPAYPGLDNQRIPSTITSNALRAYEGQSTQQARVFILDANTGAVVRDPNDLSEAHPLIIPEGNSFFTSTAVPTARYETVTDGGESWSNHVVYLGTTAIDGANRDVGAVYRLQMVGGDGQPLPVNQWALKRMYNTDKPLTGAINTFRDSARNQWVVFGTGRAWYVSDLVPCGSTASTANAACCDNHEQYFFGLKEPMNEDGFMTFVDISASTLPIVDVSGTLVFSSGLISPPISGPEGPIANFERLYAYTTGRDSAGQPLAAGYKRKLEVWRSLGQASDDDAFAALNRNIFEMVLTQPAVDTMVPNRRPNVSFSTFRTSPNICDPSGTGAMYVIDGATGLPAPYFNLYSGMTDYGKTPEGGGSAAEVVTGIRLTGPGNPSAVVLTPSGYRTLAPGGDPHDIDKPQEAVAGPGVISWREVLDMGFDLGEEADGGSRNMLFDDLK